MTNGFELKFFAEGEVNMPCNPKGPSLEQPPEEAADQEK